MSTARQRVSTALKKFQPKPQIQVGTLGNTAGVVNVPGKSNYVYVTVPGSGTLVVYNERVPAVPGMPVEIGRDPLEPDLYQVVNVHRYPTVTGASTTPSGGAPAKHAPTHNWAGTDPVYIEKRQLMPLRTTATGDMNIFVTRETAYYDGGWQFVSGTNLDMSAYVPATGSMYALIYKDIDEQIKVDAGGTVRDVASLTLQDGPQPGVDVVPLALVRLYSGQSGIYDNPNITDIVDVRPLFNVGGSSGSSKGTVVGGSGEYFRRDATNGPIVGPFSVNANSTGTFRVQSATYNLGSEISSGSIDVTDQDGATISGLTIGNWYAVENFNGPWSPWPNVTPAFYIFAASNTSSGETFHGWMGHVDAIPDDPLDRYPFPVNHADYPTWGSFGEPVGAYYYRFYFKATDTSIRVRGAAGWIGPNPGNATGTLSWKLSSATAVFEEALNVDTVSGVTTIKQLATPVTSTLVANLNADMVDGKHANELGGGTGTYIGGDDANITAINFTEQISPPSVPGTGHELIYAKSGGIYVINHAGVETGPFGALPTFPYYEPLTNGNSTSPELVFINGDIIMVQVI